MPFLLDTHAFLWAANDPDRLGVIAREWIESQSRQGFLSIASVWEMNVKFGTGKLRFATSPNEFVQEQLDELKLRLLPVEMAHLAPLGTMPLHHRDPFDRLLIAQSLVEGMPLVSADEAFDAYRELGVEPIW